MFFFICRGFEIVFLLCCVFFNPLYSLIICKNLLKFSSVSGSILWLIQIFYVFKATMPVTLPMIYDFLMEIRELEAANRRGRKGKVRGIRGLVGEERAKVTVVGVHSR